MFEKPMNQNLGTNKFGNRVHVSNNKPPTDVTKLTQVDPNYVNPRNNLETTVGKDSDRTVRRTYYDRSKVESD
jgi:hypothetical protein